MTLAVFHDIPCLENGLTKFHDFPGRVVTLITNKQMQRVLCRLYIFIVFRRHLCYIAHIMTTVTAATSTDTNISQRDRQTSAWSSMTEQIVSSVLRTPITVIALSSVPSVVDPSMPTNVCAYSHIISHALSIGFCLSTSWTSSRTSEIS